MTDEENEEVTCGQCAAYPCFREEGKNTPAGRNACFQLVRRCRQECVFYLSKELRNENGELTRCPANGGTCKQDRTSVKYEQECHIPEMRERAANDYSA